MPNVVGYAFVGEVGFSKSPSDIARRTYLQLSFTTRSHFSFGKSVYSYPIHTSQSPHCFQLIPIVLNYFSRAKDAGMFCAFTLGDLKYNTNL